MNKPRMLSGSQLVAKGATRKVDGQLPELGIKDVSANGSWLEQKQIQSALEARKHLLEVERIEKSGSLSHAVWRDDLKCAEVTKKTGSHWQYIGHNVGKHLYLQPEETLFLIEVNCLLLKHNEVTVSLQKAYCLCLGEISIAQYKVYASLSRLGYRVFRHKEPTPDNKSVIQMDSKDIKILTYSTAPKEDSQESPTVSDIKEQQSGDSILTTNIIEKKEAFICNKNETEDSVEEDQSDCKVDVKSEECGSSTNETSNDASIIKDETLSIAYSDESDSLIPLINADNVKVEIIENHTGSEIIENDINKAIERTLQLSGVDPSKEFTGTGDRISPIDEPEYSENEATELVNINNSITTEDIRNIAEDQETNMPTHDEELVDDIENISERVLNVNEDTTIVEQGTDIPHIELDMYIENENSINAEKTAAAMNLDDSRETIQMITENNTNTENRIAIINATVDTERSNCVIPAVVYSVDESGVIRVFGNDVIMKTDVADSNVADVATNCSKSKITDPGSSINKHYDLEINHYNAKMQKLIERKSNAGQRSNFEGIDIMQDFYQRQVVAVNVPDEKYLPRNIFLHKTAYVINVDTVRNQNASNANISSNEMDLIESPNRASRGTDAPGFADLPRFIPNEPFHSAYPRYPGYRMFGRPSPHWNPRLNYDSFYNYNMFRPPHNYFVHPRYRFPSQPFIRQRFTNYSVNAPRSTGNNQTDKQNTTLKEFHFDAIAQITTRFKTGIGRPAQVQALNNLLCTYNSRYNEHLELSRDFDIIDRKQQYLREVIVLDDDEPIRKKTRFNDDTKKINNNLKKLKELAAKLKELHRKNLAVSRHRRVFSKAIKTFNKSFNADLYLDSNFEIKDRKLIVLDSSSDSDAVVSTQEKGKSKKRKKLRNPYNILKHGSKKINFGASTSREVPILQKLSLNVINERAGTSQNVTCENNTNIAPHILQNSGESLLKYFDKGWLPSDDDFGRAELCSREYARLDAPFFEAEYLYEVLKQSVAEFENWLDLKLAILKEIQGTLDIQKQQAEALSNDYLMNTESQIQPILGPNCTDIKSALNQLAIIPTNDEIPTETSLKIHFDVCNRDVHFKKSNPPTPNFRVICCEESAGFPPNNDVIALHAKYDDAVPTVFAFIGISGSISYLQINSINLPMYIPDNDLI